MNPAPNRKPRPILSMETLPATTERRSPVTMSAEEAAMAFSKVYSSIFTSTCCARITRGLVHFITSSRLMVLIGGHAIRKNLRPKRSESEPSSGFSRNSAIDWPLLTSAKKADAPRKSSPKSSRTNPGVLSLAQASEKPWRTETR